MTTYELHSYFQMADGHLKVYFRTINFFLGASALKEEEMSSEIFKKHFGFLPKCPRPPKSKNKK